MKSSLPYFFVITVLTMSLPGCNVESDKDVAVEAVGESGVYESKSAKTANDEITLVSSSLNFPKGSRLKQSRQVELKHHGMTIKQGEDTITGAAEIDYKETRDVEVMSSSIWKILISESSIKTSTTLRGQEPNASEIPGPLANATVVRDGDRISMDGAIPTDEQKKALKSFQADWFGGNTLFPDKPVKMRSEWEVKPETLLEAIMGETFTNGSGKVTLLVNKVFTFDNQKTAEIGVSMRHIQGTMIDEDGGDTEVNLDAYGTLYRSLESLHTTRVEFKGNISLSTKSPEATVTFSGPFECRANSDVTQP